MRNRWRLRRSIDAIGVIDSKWGFNIMLVCTGSKCTALPIRSRLRLDFSVKRIIRGSPIYTDYPLNPNEVNQSRRFSTSTFCFLGKKNISAENAADQRGRFTSKEVRQRRSLIKYIFWGKWSICVDLPYPYHILPDPRKRLTDTVSSSHPEDASCNLYLIRTCFWSLVWPITATIAYVVLCGMLE